MSIISSPNGMCSLANSLTSCAIGSYPQNGGSYYYSPLDSNDVQFFGRSVGQCSSGSYADVALYSGSYPGNFLVDCGCLSLDGGDHLLDCPGIAKNSLTAGVYNFQAYLGVNVGLDQFTIFTSQVTVAAPTPSTTVTTTTYESTTTTDTATLSYTTVTTPTLYVTSPAATSDTSTVSITPSPLTSTTTRTATTTKTETFLTVKQVTKTVSAPCKASTPKILEAKPVARKGFRHYKRAETTGNGYTLANGDGQLTITTTPPGVVITNTADGGTITGSTTTTTSVFTTSTAPYTTATVLSGTFLTQETTTLAPKTSTKTVNTQLTKTASLTDTITWVHTMTTTPICKTTAPSKLLHKAN